MSMITDIADAVVVELNGADCDTFDQKFTAARMTIPLFEKKDLSTLRVSVVPKSIDTVLATRTVSQYDVFIDIGIQKSITKSVDKDVELMSDLVDQISDFMRNKQLADVPLSAWLKTTNDPIYSIDHLRLNQVFTSVLTLTYRVIK